MLHIISTKFSVYNYDLSRGQEKFTSIVKIIFMITIFYHLSLAQFQCSNT